MIIFESGEIKFIKEYKKQCELEIIQIKDLLNDKEKIKFFPTSFLDKVDNRLNQLEFLYHIFDKLEQEVF